MFDDEEEEEFVNPFADDPFVVDNLAHENLEHNEDGSQVWDTDRESIDVGSDEYPPVSSTSSSSEGRFEDLESGMQGGGLNIAAGINEEEGERVETESPVQNESLINSEGRFEDLEAGMQGGGLNIAAGMDEAEGERVETESPVQNESPVENENEPLINVTAGEGPEPNNCCIIIAVVVGLIEVTVLTWLLKLVK